MEEGLVDPLSLAKDASLIKDAQTECGNLDVLICGSCLSVFHFVEEYNTHKSKKCEDSPLSKNCEHDFNSLTWAFCLWKNSEVKDKSLGTWQVYQKWCKLPSEEQNKWIAGGQTILSLNKIRLAKMQEVKFKVKREEEKDPLALTENDAHLMDNTESKNPVNRQLQSKSLNSNDNIASVGNDSKKEELNEYVVESIQGKRFNAKKKSWEYKVKWENWDESQCSWEPIEHLTGCKALINLFEEKLKIEKEKKRLAAEEAKLRLQAELKTDDESIDYGAGRRPQRSSKKRALHQVKRWLGEGGSDDDTKDNKRAHEDDSDDMSFEKRMKMDDDSDDSIDDEDEDRPRKMIKHISSNGMATKKLPNNVLIPDAQGVVRINQKQLPSLSSGVYIMSKTAGIIKLDSKTSKIAASGGQAVVKVAPRIGQTHIRIVKKDGGTANRIIQMTPKSKPATKTPRTLISHKVTKMVRNPTSKVSLESKTDGAKDSAADEDSDSGLPELEFPSEIIAPEPEEPPGDFILDPTTGKIAGVEYTENEGAQGTTEDNKENSENTLDNIVKLAAADITEADLKPDIGDGMITESTSEAASAPSHNMLAVVGRKPDMHRVEQMKVKKEATPMGRPQQKFVISPNIRSSTILERSLQAPRTAVVKAHPGFPRQVYTKTPQRIINSAMTPKLTSPLMRSSSVMRNAYSSKPRPVLPKQQRVYVSSGGVNMSRTLDDNMVRQTYHHHKVAPNKRVVGNTSLYKKPVQMNKMATSTPKTAPRTNVIRKPAPMAKTVQKTPRPVINMPSLMDDDEPTQPVTETLQIAPQKEMKVEMPQESSEPTLSSTVDPGVTAFSPIADGEGAPIFITGDDGTLYQVAGQNEQGQTILLTEGPDGQQQCLLVTNEAINSDENQEEGAAGMQQITSMAEGTDAEMPAQQQQTEASTVEAGAVVEAQQGQEPLTIKTEPESDIVAQFVKAVPPSPGGTPKVMVMLPNGDLVVTPVTAEEYASWQEMEK